jgi:two-component system, chemotaxis family, chemotaxis protein CheY
MSVQKILVVEDSELLHRMYDLVFVRYKNQGAKVLHAYNGREGLELLDQNPDTQIVLLDINMPVMSGMQFLETCNQKGVCKYLPIVIISTEGKEQDTIRGLKAGARAYLTKPFLPKELHSVIDTLVEGKPGTSIPQPLAQKTQHGV